MPFRPAKRHRREPRLRHGFRRNIRCSIRVNGGESQWFREDLALCKAKGVAGVLLPKAESVEDIRIIGGYSGGAPILPLIETARGFWNAHALAQAPRVQRFVFGSIDFQLDLGIQGEEEELLYFRSQSGVGFAHREPRCAGRRSDHGD